MTQSTILLRNAKLARRCGRVLIGVFVVTILAVVFPLQFGAPNWGLRLTSAIANAASLPLVGVALLRYAAFLDIKAYLESTGDLPPFDNSNTEKKFLRDPRKTEFAIRRFAKVGFVGLALLSIYQVVLYFNTLNTIDSQYLASSKLARQNFQEIELNIKQKPDQLIDQAWQQLQSNKPQLLGGSSVATPIKRKNLLTLLQANLKQQQVANQQKLNDAHWGLGRETLRVISITLLYAWGFYGLHSL